MQEIREEQPSDYRESENVLREAFWNVYSIRHSSPHTGQGNLVPSSKSTYMHLKPFWILLRWYELCICYLPGLLDPQCYLE